VLSHRRQPLKKSVLIAGIAGASLGTELFKSLRQTGRYSIYGADISPYAYGLYEQGFARTYVVDLGNYIASILEVCKRHRIDVIVPGGEGPLYLLTAHRDLFDRENIILAMNSTRLVELCTNKARTFEYLNGRSIPIPETRLIDDIEELRHIKYPCVLKPSTGSGGSVFVHLAEDANEAIVYASYLKRRGVSLVAQDYISHDEGEYSVGVLSLPSGEILGSIAMQKVFSAKLSYVIKYKDRIISSPYSQGLIDDFKDVRRQAENIALEIDSRGPLNIQGRLVRGVFYPFEINPRFSGGTYLRAMAGFNEIDMFLRFVLEGKRVSPKKIKRGYFLRSLKEEYICCRAIKT